jgi:hypothetical protein
MNNTIDATAMNYDIDATATTYTNGRPERPVSLGAMKDVADEMASNTAMTTMDLSNSVIGPTGVKTLVDALRTNTTLTALNIQDTLLGEAARKLTFVPEDGAVKSVARMGEAGHLLVGLESKAKMINREGSPVWLGMDEGFACGSTTGTLIAKGVVGDPSVIELWDVTNAPNSTLRQIARPPGRGPISSMCFSNDDDNWLMWGTTTGWVEIMYCGADPVIRHSSQEQAAIQSVSLVVQGERVMGAAGMEGGVVALMEIADPASPPLDVPLDVPKLNSKSRVSSVQYSADGVLAIGRRTGTAISFCAKAKMFCIGKPSEVSEACASLPMVNCLQRVGVLV